jgi:hypothetical protein
MKKNSIIKLTYNGTVLPVEVLRFRNTVQDPDPFPRCLGSGSGFISYSNEHNKITWKENLTKNTFCVGPVGLTDKENQVKLCKKVPF